MFTAVMSIAMVVFVAVARSVFIRKMDELLPDAPRHAAGPAHV